MYIYILPDSYFKGLFYRMSQDMSQDIKICHPVFCIEYRGNIACPFPQIRHESQVSFAGNVAILYSVYVSVLMQKSPMISV